MIEDDLALALDMERGTPKAVSGVRGIDTRVYKEKMEKERLAEKYAGGKRKIKRDSSIGRGSCQWKNNHGRHGKETETKIADKTDAERIVAARDETIRQQLFADYKPRQGDRTDKVATELNASEQRAVRLRPAARNL